MNEENLHDLAALRACGAHSWQEIGDRLGVSWQTARGQWRRHCQDLEPGPCPICGSEGADQSSWSEQGNYAEARAQGGRVTSLNQLLGAARVDLSTWQIVDWGVKKWEVGAKLKEGDLQFDRGKISGELHYSGIGVEKLWSVWAKFIRRQPVAIRPAVQPVACSVSYDVQPNTREGVKSGILASDLHLGYRRDNRTGELEPFHDRRAIDILLQLAAVGGRAWDYIGILGDFLDLTNWNDKYSRSPEFYWTTQPAILEGHWILRKLRELAPHAEIDLFMGNHENRIKRSLEKHLLEAYDLRAADELDLPPAMSPQRLLALHKLGVGWVGGYPSGERWLGPLRLSHGDVARKPPGASTRAMVEDTLCDNAFGHTHRLELVSKRVRVRDGVQVVKSLSTGCMCHTDGRVPPKGAPEHWQKGLVTVAHTGDHWTPTLIGLDGGRAVVGGVEYIGQDYTEELRADLPGWNW